jgi:ribonuclease J
VKTIETLPRAKRRDPDTVAEAVRRAVRSALTAEWGKKPLCFVQVLEV